MVPGAISFSGTLYAVKHAYEYMYALPCTMLQMYPVVENQGNSAIFLT